MHLIICSLVTGILLWNWLRHTHLTAQSHVTQYTLKSVTQYTTSNSVTSTNLLYGPRQERTNIYDFWSHEVESVPKLP